MTFFLNWEASALDILVVEFHNVYPFYPCILFILCSFLFLRERVYIYIFTFHLGYRTRPAYKMC